MHKIEIPQRRLMREFPSEIAEMDREQFIYFIALVLKYVGGQITTEQFKILLTAKLLNIRMGFRYSFMSRQERELANGEIFRISELCGSFFEEIERDGKKIKSFRLSFTKNFIPLICGKFHGPKDALQDITFCEYRMAHGYFAAYLSSHNETDLDHLIAVLYRPAKRFLWLKKLLPSFDGQIRTRFNSKSNPLLLEARARKIAKLPMAERYGIFLFFAGSEEFLAKGTVNVDGKAIDLSVIYEKSDDDNSGPPDTGLIGVLYSLAETKVFGSIAKTDNQNLYDIMIRLYQVATQAKAMEAKYKNSDSN